MFLRFPSPFTPYLLFYSPSFLLFKLPSKNVRLFFMLTIVRSSFHALIFLLHIFLYCLPFLICPRHSQLIPTPARLPSCLFSTLLSDCYNVCLSSSLLFACESFVLFNLLPVSRLLSPGFQHPRNTIFESYFSIVHICTRPGLEVVDSLPMFYVI